MFGNLFSKKPKDPKAPLVSQDPSNTVQSKPATPIVTPPTPAEAPATTSVPAPKQDDVPGKLPSSSVFRTGRKNEGPFDEQLGKDLNSAAQKDDIGRINTLLANPRCDINYQNDTMPTALNQACYYGMAKAAKLLLENGADPDLLDYQKYTGFHWAAYKERLPIVELLLEYGADFTICNPSQQTARTISTSANVRALFDAHCAKKSGTPGPAAAASSSTGSTAGSASTTAPSTAPSTAASMPPPPPPAAATAGSTAFTTAPALAAVPAVINSALGRELNSAASSGNKEKIRSILSNADCYIDYQEEKMVSALNQASYYGHVDAVRFLLEKGANPNLQDYQKYTPLHWAVRKERIEIIELLLQYGGSIAVKNQNGSVPPEMSSAPAVVAVFTKHAAASKSSPSALPSVPSVPTTPPTHPAPAVEEPTAAQALEIARQQKDADEERMQPKMKSKALTVEEAASQHKVVLYHAEGAAARQSWIHRWNSMASQLNTARANRDVTTIIALEKDRRSLQEQSRELALALHDFLSLQGRYNQLCAAVEAQCEELIMVEDIDVVALEALTELLKSLKTVDPAVMEPAAIVEIDVPSTIGSSSSAEAVKAPALSVAELRSQQAIILKQAEGASARRGLCEQQWALQAKLRAAKADVDIPGVIALEEQRILLEEQSPGLALSATDFYSLAARHQQLCASIEAQCDELVTRECVDVETLEALTELLKSLRGLDLSCAEGLPTEADQDGANATISDTDLQALVDSQSKILVDRGGLAARQEWMQRRDALKVSLAAAKGARNFEQVLALEKDRKRMDEESAQLALSVADCESLPNREAALRAQVSAYMEMLLKADMLDVKAIKTLHSITDTL